jgi:hypothetical protein
MRITFNGVERNNMNQLIISLLQDKINEYSDYAKEEYERHNYYCWDDKIRQNLIALLKIRSEYKRALKEYKRQCEQIWIHKYEKQTKIWREHPDKFIEDIYGCKLFPHQKTMLKMMINNKNKFEVRP